MPFSPVPRPRRNPFARAGRGASQNVDRSTTHVVPAGQAAARIELDGVARERVDVDVREWSARAQARRRCRGHPALAPFHQRQWWMLDFSMRTPVGAAMSMQSRPERRTSTLRSTKKCAALVTRTVSPPRTPVQHEAVEDDMRVPDVGDLPAARHDDRPTALRRPHGDGRVRLSATHGGQQLRVGARLHRDGVAGLRDLQCGLNRPQRRGRRSVARPPDGDEPLLAGVHRRREADHHGQEWNEQARLAVPVGRRVRGHVGCAAR